MNIKNIGLIALLAGVSLQCQGAQSKYRLNPEPDLEYGALSLAELQEVQNHVADAMQRRENDELEQFRSLISTGGEFDQEHAVKIACTAWSKAVCPKQQKKTLNFLALLVQKGLAHELA